MQNSPAKLFMLDAWYLCKGIRAQIHEVTEESDSIVVRNVKGILFRVLKSDVFGPTHMPCPICNEMQIVRSDGMQIDLSEHITRNHL